MGLAQPAIIAPGWQGWPYLAGVVSKGRSCWLTCSGPVRTATPAGTGTGASQSESAKDATASKAPATVREYLTSTVVPLVRAGLKEIINQE